MKKQFKGFVVGFVTAFLAIGLTISAFGIVEKMTITVDPINIQVNGVLFQPKDANGNAVPVFAYNGTTYAPLRALAEAYGLTVGYDAQQNLATVTSSATASPVPSKPTPTNIPTSNPDTVSKTLTGTGSGFGGTITATITVSGDRIIACTLRGEKESFGSIALPELEEQVIATGSTAIDGVAGATMTTLGVKEAVNNALSGTPAPTPSADSSPVPSPTVTPTPDPKQKCNIGRQYESGSGYGVTVNTAKIESIKGVKTFVFKYTLKNLTKNKYLSEGTFRFVFTDGTTSHQGGIYLDGIYPGEKLTKTYNLILEDKELYCIIFDDPIDVSDEEISKQEAAQNILKMLNGKFDKDDLSNHLVWYLVDPEEVELP